MRIAPWHVMLGLAALLIVYGLLVLIDVREPGELAGLMIFLALLLGTTYAGYKVGTSLGSRGE